MADIDLLIKISENDYDHIKRLGPLWIESARGLSIVSKALLDGIPLPPGREIKFEEIVVSYLPDELCTYPEYKGKPYFQIKYEVNGEHIIGFGTYKPEVLSEYLRDYFITPTIIIESDKGE